MLRQTTESLISEYINRNGLDESDILIRQYDGFLTKKLLSDTDQYLPLELKDIYSKMVVAITGDKYIATTGKRTIIKGVANYYNELEPFYNELFNINFLSKSHVFNCLDRIKKGFLECKDIKVFCIPYDEKYNTIFFKTYGNIKISKQVSKMAEHEEVDKQVYYNIYLKPFIQGIIMDFI